MSKLGVHQWFSDSENMRIIKKKFMENPEHTIKQVRFLIALWRGKHTQRAKSYYAEVLKFRDLETKVSDSHFIDYSLTAKENHDNLCLPSDKKYSEEELDCEELEYLSNDYDNPSDLEWIWNSCKKENNSVLIDRVKEWIRKQRAIEIAWERKRKDKRKQWVRSCKWDVKVIL